MKNNVEEFLLEYKKLELVCRQKYNKEIKEIEEELGEGNDIGNKLRICRQLRNFVSHNPYEDFITIDKGMIRFIKEYGKDKSKAKPKLRKTNSKRKVKNNYGKRN